MGTKRSRKNGGNPGVGGRRPAKPTTLRIVGGRLRGRRILYSGDHRLRPMKDRVREALFNLIGPTIRGTHVVDLFAGTGAVGLEAISRGALRATLVEHHFPSWQMVRENASTLQVNDQVEAIRGDAFAWARNWPGDDPTRWLVVICPPYQLFLDRWPDLLTMLDDLISRAPEQSIFVVEADDRFDFSQLPLLDQWDVRRYPPAVVGIYRKESTEI